MMQTQTQVKYLILHVLPQISELFGVNTLSFMIKIPLVYEYFLIEVSKMLVQLTN